MYNAATTTYLAIQPFILKKSACTSPTCHFLIPPKLPLLAAILRLQQVGKIITNKYDNHNNTILYANIFIEVYRLKFLSNEQPPSVMGSSRFIEPIQNVDNSISMLKLFCRSIQYNGKTDNNDNSSGEILSEQCTFYQPFSELAHFWNEKLKCILSAGHFW